MNSKNGFFGLVPPASTAAPVPPPAPAPAQAPAPTPENAWPLAHALPLGPGNEPAMLSRDEKHAAWRTAPEARPEGERAAPRPPSKGELLAAGLRQMRQSQRTQAERAAGGQPAQAPVPDSRPHTVTADMTWPDQRISVPISPEARVPSPPMPIEEAAAPRPPTSAPAAVATHTPPAPQPMPAAPAPVPAWPAPQPAAAAPRPTPPAAPLPPVWPEAQARPEVPPAPAPAPVAPAAPVAPSAPAAAAVPTAPEGKDIRQVFARLRGDEASAKAPAATPAAADPAKPRGGFLSRLGKK